MQRGKAVRILINLFVIAAATISMIPFVLMFFMVFVYAHPYLGTVMDRVAAVCLFSI